MGLIRPASSSTIRDSWSRTVTSTACASVSRTMPLSSVSLSGPTPTAYVSSGSPRSWATRTTRR